MNRIFLVAIILLAACVAVTQRGTQPSIARTKVTASEIYVVDGDTIRLGRERIRLAGYDAPEIFSPGCPDELVHGQRATNALKSSIRSARTIELGRKAELDRYGRSVAILWIDGKDVAQRMVRAGLAREYGRGKRKTWCS